MKTNQKAALCARAYHARVLITRRKSRSVRQVSETSSKAMSHVRKAIVRVTTQTNFCHAPSIRIVYNINRASSKASALATTTKREAISHVMKADINHASSKVSVLATIRRATKAAISHASREAIASKAVSVLTTSADRISRADIADRTLRATTRMPSTA